MSEIKHRVYVEKGHIDMIAREMPNNKEVVLTFILNKYKGGCQPQTETVDCILPFPLKKVWLKRFMDGLTYLFGKVLS